MTRTVSSSKLSGQANLGTMILRAKDRSQPQVFGYTAAPAVKGDGWLPPKQLMIDRSLDRVSRRDTRRSEARSSTERRSIAAIRAATAKTLPGGPATVSVHRSS